MQPVVNVDQSGGPVAIAVEGGGASSRQINLELFKASLPGPEALSQTESVNADIGDTNFQLDKVMESLKSYPGRNNFYISFEIDDRTESVVVKVVDRETQEVLCQIPPEAILNMKARMRELQGAFFDHQA